jgi:hypothetical protein
MDRQDPAELRRMLIEEYAKAANHYAWAVEELNRHRSTLPKVQYQDAYFLVENAREECERLRSALAKFRDEK